MIFTYPAVIREEDGTFYAAVPDVPGCITTGRSLNDALAQITDALSACLCTKEEAEDPIPPASNQAAIPCPPGTTCVTVRVDTERYRAGV